MKKFYKAIILLSITCALGFCACSKEPEQLVEEPINETKEEVIEETFAKLIMTKEEIHSSIEVVDQHVAIDYVSDDKTTVGVYMFLYIKNNYTDKVIDIDDAAITLYDNNGYVMDSEDGCIATLAPQEIGILGEHFEVTKEDIDNRFDVKLEVKSASNYPVSQIGGFKQSDLTFGSFVTKSDDVMNTEVLLDITNNAEKSPKSFTARIACKKAGKYVGFVESNFDYPLKKGETTTLKLDGSHMIPSDCDDYDVFIDYIDWVN